jgi:GT2 family glycosyltransferase
MVSVIICSITPAKFQRVTQVYRRLLAGNEFEIVGIHDAKGMAEGYNRGLAQSRGELVIFSHDDVEFLAPEFAPRLLEHMSHCDVLGVAGTTRLIDAKWVNAGMPYVYGQVAAPNRANGTFELLIWSAAQRRVDGMMALDGVFLCVRRPVAQALRFDERSYRDFHLYDIDFTFRAHLTGHRLSVASDLYVVHESTGSASRTWLQDAAHFQDKFRTSLSPPTRCMSKFTLVSAPTAAEVVEVMTPPHWGP